MALLDILKRKKKEKPVVEKKPTQEEKPVEKKEVAQKRSTSIVYGVIREPHISEKTTDLGEIDQYVFRVFPRARKPEIKKAVEAMYGVDVLAVKIIRIPRKKRRLGRTSGFKKGYKKAVVKIQKGQKIEIL